MAHPVKWGGDNGTLVAPNGVDGLSCQPLPVFINGVTCVSCWELNDEELAEIVKSRRVFVSVYSGCTQPPVAIGIERDIHQLVADYGAWKLD